MLLTERGARETHSGGVVFLRPCRAVADDMIKVSLPQGTRAAAHARWLGFKV